MKYLIYNISRSSLNCHKPVVCNWGNTSRKCTCTVDLACWLSTDFFVYENGEWLNDEKYIFRPEDEKLISIINNDCYVVSIIDRDIKEIIKIVNTMNGYCQIHRCDNSIKYVEDDYSIFKTYISIWIYMRYN